MATGNLSRKTIYLFIICVCAYCINIKYVLTV